MFDSLIVGSFSLVSYLNVKYNSVPQTRVLVTHGVGFLPQVDQIIVLQDGRISEVCFFSFDLTLTLIPLSELQRSFIVVA